MIFAYYSGIFNNEYFLFVSRSRTFPIFSRRIHISVNRFTLDPSFSCDRTQTQTDLCKEKRELVDSYYEVQFWSSLQAHLAPDAYGMSLGTCLSPSLLSSSARWFYSQAGLPEVIGRWPAQSSRPILCQFSKYLWENSTSFPVVPGNVLFLLAQLDSCAQSLE